MLLKYEQLNDIKRNHKDKKIGYTKGTFDLFHYGHLTYLSSIKSESDILIVEVKSDNDVKNKGVNRPIIKEFERASIVDNIKSVDYTIIANEEHTTPLIKMLIDKNNYSKKETEKLLKDGYLIEQVIPNVIYIIQGQEVSKPIKDICKELNIKINVIPCCCQEHTTNIIERCRTAK